MDLISKERAQAFAEALIANHGNATAAARQLEYDNPSSTGHRYSRHPLVLRALAPLAAAHLSALTPKAIQTLSALLNTGSPYVRLEAAKDILDRNGVGTSHEAPRSQQLVVNINLGDSLLPSTTAAAVVLEQEALPLDVEEGVPLENSGSTLPSTSSTHDFSTEVLGEEIAQPLALERSPKDSLIRKKGDENFFAENSDFDLE